MEKKDEHPREFPDGIEFAANVDPGERESLRGRFVAAAEKAHSHVRTQHGFAEEDMQLLETVETQFLVNNGIVLPIVIIDDDEQHVLVPQDQEVTKFIEDCLIRLAKDRVTCAFMSTDHFLNVVRMTKTQVFFAQSKVTINDIGSSLGEWHLLPISEPGRRALSTEVQTESPRRNEPCPCGSGKRFKHCCRRRQRRPGRIMDRDRFASAVINAIRKAGDNGPISYDQADRSLSRDGAKLYLHNAYDEYRAAPAIRHNKIISNWASAWFVSGATFRTCTRTPLMICFL